MRDELRGEKDTYAGGGGGLGEKREGQMHVKTGGKETRGEKEVSRYSRR